MARCGAPSDPMPIRRTSKTPQAEETARREIQQATLVLVEKFGFSKLSLNDIAQELGKTKGFLYYYYQDKEAIFRAALRSKVDEAQADLVRALSRERSGMDKIRRYCFFLHERIQAEMPNTLRLREDIRSKQPALMDGVMDAVNSVTQMNIPLLEDLLREGVQDGSFPPSDSEQIQGIARIIAWTMQGFVFECIMGTPELDPEQLLRTILYLRPRELKPGAKPDGCGVRERRLRG